MILCFDLDNVICVTKNMVYKKAKPITKTIKLINKAYKLGFKINIFKQNKVEYIIYYFLKYLYYLLICLPVYIMPL